MKKRRLPTLLGLLIWLVGVGLTAVSLTRTELDASRERFENQARAAHRLLSQKALQNETVLATLALWPGDAAQAAQQLRGIYPQFVGLLSKQRGVAGEWAEPGLDAAEEASARLRQPVLSGWNAGTGRYWLVQAGAAGRASHAVQIDAAQMVPWSEWPQGLARFELGLNGDRHLLQAGEVPAAGFALDFAKPLASASQPLVLHAAAAVAYGALPWAEFVLRSVALAFLVFGLVVAWHQRVARRRAEDLLRLGHVARVNTFGELAGGMVHELKQPLTAVLAHCRTAQRLLAEPAPDIAALRTAVDEAAAGAGRVAEIMRQLRLAMARPTATAPMERMELSAAVDDVLHLLDPELRRRRVAVVWQQCSEPTLVRANRLTLALIIQQLVVNALQAMEVIPESERQLSLRVAAADDSARLDIADSGPGIADEAMSHVFEPFYTTGVDGVGLGLSLCESLARSLDGKLSAANGAPRGAIFSLTLPRLAVA